MEHYFSHVSQSEKDQEIFHLMLFTNSFFLFVCLFVLFCFNSLSILFIYLFWQIFGALNFPEPMKEKNIQAVSNSLNFSYLSALRSAFSGFNLWLGSEGQGLRSGGSCAQNISRNREWSQILPCSIPMKNVDKVYFQESISKNLFLKVGFCLKGHTIRILLVLWCVLLDIEEGLFYSSARKNLNFYGILLVECLASISLPLYSTRKCYFFCQLMYEITEDI